MKQFKISLVFFLLIGPICLLIGSEVYAAKKGTIRILWTNDTHGYLIPLYHREEGESNYMEIAAHEGQIGGWANLATVIKKLRGELPKRTLLLDAGDTWHGTGVPLFTKGKAIVEVMNTLKYDAMTPGNVDFLYSKEIFLKRVAECNFPVIAANITDMEWGDPVLPKYTVKKLDGLKIVIIGATYQWTAKTGDRAFTKDWSFGLREDEIRELIKELREKEKPDLVILLSHMGYKVDQKFASRVDGIDVIIGAHTHDNVHSPPVINNTIVVQAGSHGKFLGKLDIEIKDGKVAHFDHQIIRIVSKDIKPDPEISQLVELLYRPYEEKLKRVIGETKTIIYRRARWQNPMDNFITDTYREIEKGDVAFSPAWRFGATILPGDIKVEDVYNMVPTEGHIFTFRLKGSNIKSILENAIDNVLNEDPYLQLGGDMIRFSGMEVRYDEKKPYGSRIVGLKIGGKPLDKEKIYTIVSANTQIYKAPTSIDPKDTGKVAVEELIQYIEKKKVIAPELDDRIKNDAHSHN